MRRRLLLARALMHEPRLVILDEPTAGVDFELRLELWRYIRRLHAEGTTILLTTHYLEEAEELCEDIALIRDGRIIARDTADGLRAAYDASRSPTSTSRRWRPCPERRRSRGSGSRRAPGEREGGRAPASASPASTSSLSTVSPSALRGAEKSGVGSSRANGDIATSLSVRGEGPEPRAARWRRSRRAR